MGKQFLATIHRRPVLPLDTLHHDFQADFIRHARTSSFFIYEIWDDLIENYLTVQNAIEDHVKQLQNHLIGAIDNRVFRRVSELGSDLLHFRKMLLPDLTVLTEIASRKSIFFSKTTQPFLANMVGNLERAIQDLLFNREILSDSLNLQMSMSTHRTNEVVKCLTVVNTIFLPLTFLCDVYGMNFNVFPELHWRYSYVVFWIAVVLITLIGVVVLRKERVL